MYMIDYPNTSNFLDAYTYLSVPRWYYEQIGYWGAPNTPPPGEEHAQGIKPFNVPTEPTVDAYKEKYPDGFYQPYKMCEEKKAATAVPVAPATVAADHVSAAAPGGLSMGAVFAALLVGLVGGIGGTLLYVKKQYSGYELIR